tara:strand:- start:1498 stop:2139 length:642 start_codon:yes stop_codon:yes gene_type:complete
MINKKIYIPITKNNIIRSQSNLKSEPNNFITKNDLNAEISANRNKLKTKRISMKLYGASYASIGSDGNGGGGGGTPTETFAISASFITGNAGTGWATAWKFSTNGNNAVDRSGPLSPTDNYGSNRTLNFNMGDTIRFENIGINSFYPREEGRPFTIRNISGVGTTDLAEGVVNNSSTLGPIFFTPVAAGTYYYNDSSDSSNGQGRNWGQIIIT